MSKVDWSKAPDGAEFYSFGSFYKKIDGSLCYYANHVDDWCESIYSITTLAKRGDYELAPTISLDSPKWPTEDRIDNIGRNRTDDDLGHYNRNADEALGKNLNVYSEESQKPKSSAEFLSECLRIQTERGKQYDAKGNGERSFAAAAEAFNSVTGNKLKGSDVCLILEMVKLVRQYSSPERLHEDSVVDKVSYSSLWAEQITQELSGQTTSATNNS